MNPCCCNKLKQKSKKSQVHVEADFAHWITEMRSCGAPITSITTGKGDYYRYNNAPVAATKAIWLAIVSISR
ncbi:MAG: hypothetical protein Q8M27_10430 [Methylotenera sp.]|nr:hypothetical protein [Methylotenera sp.]